MEKREIKTKRIIEKLIRDPRFQNAQTIGVTISNFPEIDTHHLIEYMWKQGKEIYCPKVMPNHKMDFIKIDQDTHFIKSSFGIWEPERIEKKIQNQFELMIVPGIVFALDNHQRIGFGGGYYDRFLYSFSGKTISLAFAEQTVEKCTWKYEETDFMINQIITDFSCTRQ